MEVAISDNDVHSVSIHSCVAVIILVIPKTEVRRYLVIAHDLGMTNGDYQFLYTERTVSDKTFLSNFTSRSFWEIGAADDEKARQGYHNLLYVSVISCVYVFLSVLMLVIFPIVLFLSVNMFES